ncbi:hypothetical protein GN956_G23815 [Arapaima gigas]
MRAKRIYSLKARSAQDFLSGGMMTTRGRAYVSGSSAKNAARAADITTEDPAGWRSGLNRGAEQLQLCT